MTRTLAFEPDAADGPGFFRYAGWSAILSGVTLMVSFLALSVFFALVPTHGKNNIFGPINDYATIVGTLLMVPMLLGLNRLASPRAPGLARAMLALGLLGALTMSGVMTLFVVGLVSLRFTFIVPPPAFAFVTIAVGVLSWLVRPISFWPRTLVWLGAIVGLAGAVVAAGFFLSVDAPQDLFKNPLAGGGMAVSALGYTVWSVIFGRLLLRRAPRPVLSGATA